MLEVTRRPRVRLYMQCQEAPHVAWPTDGTLARSMQVATENGRWLAAGEALLYRIV